MKNPFLYLLILCSTLLIAASCNDKDDPEPDSVEEKIKGEYTLRYTATVGGEGKWQGDTMVIVSKIPKGHLAYPAPHTNVAITVKDDNNSPYFPFETMCGAWKEVGVIKINSRSMGELGNPLFYNEMIVHLDVEFMYIFNDNHT